MLFLGLILVVVIPGLRPSPIIEIKIGPDTGVVSKETITKMNHHLSKCEKDLEGDCNELIHPVIDSIKPQLSVPLFTSFLQHSNRFSSIKLCWKRPSRI